MATVPPDCKCTFCLIPPLLSLAYLQGKMRCISEPDQVLTRIHTTSLFNFFFCFITLNYIYGGFYVLDPHRFWSNPEMEKQ